MLKSSDLSEVLQMKIPSQNSLQYPLRDTFLCLFLFNLFLLLFRLVLYSSGLKQSLRDALNE